ncbi:hypothetical protein [Natrononativus amylolyticus]|uniref:hypothetical protein n=1 Tax=Natrononativus amylolyticus TaxID=2963434 RepID=UPI0020CBFA9C|nr:hypothetical protein [Natrononativus amylolyticus]
MTTGPKLRLGKALVPGVLAVALFAVMALIVLNTPFGGMEGFSPGDTTITDNIGYAMLDLTELQEIDSEPFLASFLLAAVVLDAALDASLVLAKREEAGEPVTALSSRSDPGADEGAQPAVTDGGEGGENA